MPDDALTQHERDRRVARGQHGAARGRNLAMFAGAFLLMMTYGVMHGADQLPAIPASRPTTQRVVNHPAAAVVRQFHDHLKADRQNDARKLLAGSPKPVRDADRRVKRLSASLTAGGSDFSVLDAKDSGGDAAVVLVNDFLKDGRKTIDIKPWYLVRQQGEWRLLAKFTDYELKEYGLSDAALADFKKLEDWAERREPQLRKEQPDCGC